MKMAIRDCAKKSKVFCSLLERYENRDAEIEKWRQKKEKVIGVWGADVPEELLVAAGLHPVRVYAPPSQTLGEADKYLEFAFDPMARAQFDRVVNGTYGRLLDGLAISNSTDVLIRLYLYLRELKRIEPQKNIPELAYIDWLFSRNLLYQQYNEKTIRLFWEQVEQWSGQPLSDEKIREAIAEYNRNRQALRNLDKLRSGAQIRLTGSEMLVVVGSGFFMERREHTRLVEQLNREALEWPSVDGVRLFYTGSAQTSLELYQQIEELGYVIVGEDHDWGARFYSRDCNMQYDAVRALVDCYMLREFSSKKALVGQRVESLKRMVRAANAQVAFFYTHIYEEAASWEYPSQKKALEAEGIGTIHFAKMHWPMTDQERQSVESELRDFKKRQEVG